MAMTVAAVHSAQQGGSRVRLTEITATAPSPYGYRADYDLAQLATLGNASGVVGATPFCGWGGHEKDLPVDGMMATTGRSKQ